MSHDQDEHYFLVHVDRIDADATGWTDQEREHLELALVAARRDHIL